VHKNSCETKLKTVNSGYPGEWEKVVRELYFIKFYVAIIFYRKHLFVPLVIFKALNYAG